MTRLCLSETSTRVKGVQLHRTVGAPPESHHKRCGGQAGHRGAGMGEVWFLTQGRAGQGSAGQGGRTGGLLHFHQHLFTELSPRARLREQAGRNSNGADVSPILEMLGACVSVRIIRRGHSTRNQPVQLTTATVMNKEGLRNSQRPKEIRETGGLNAMWCAGLDPNTGHLRKN